MPAIPLRGDRSAWNAASYRTLHTNDIDVSASAIHHTLGASASQAAFGNHTHELDDLGSDASSYGQLLTSSGNGFSNWEWLTNHSHSGSTPGGGGQLAWDNIWIDAVHDHSGSAQGDKFNITNLSSGAIVAGYVLTTDGSGSAIWSAPSSTITTLDSIPNVYVPAPNDGQVLTWNASSGSWIAYTPVDWRVTLTQDESTDDSDKIFTVPTGYEWQILWVWVEYTSSGTGGIRQLEIQIQDSSSNVIGQFQTGVTQSEGLVYKYLFGIGVPDLTTVRDDNNVTTPLPAATFLSAGQKIRIWDNNTVDASADDMIVRMQYASRNLSIQDFNPPTSIRNSTHLLTSDKITLTQYRVLSIKNVSQLQASSKPELSWRFTALTIDNATQTQTSDIITLPVQTYNLVVNSSTQLQTSGNVALTQYQILAIHNSTIKSVVDKVTLSLMLHYYPVANSTTQAQTSESVTLSFYQGVETQTSSHTQTANNLILTQYQILEINSSTQIQPSGNVTLTQHQILVVNTTTQSQISSTIMSDFGELLIQSTMQTQTSDNIELTFYQGVITQAFSHIQISGNIRITTNMYILKINNSVQVQTCNHITSLNSRITLIMKNSVQVQTSDKIDVIRRATLTVNNSVQTEISDKVTLTQYQKPLTIRDTSARLVNDKITLQNLLYNEPLGIHNSNQISISDKITLV